MLSSSGSRPARRPRRRARNNALSVSRGLSNELTGGTNDVKPQYLTCYFAQSAADTATTFTQAMPVLRNFSGTGNNRAQLVEVLKVYMSPSNQAEVDSDNLLLLSTKNFGTTAQTPGDPSVFAFYKSNVRLTTSGQILTTWPFVYDCTDGNGNGLLIATDNIYIQASSTNTGLAQIWFVKIIYRIYAATVTEYVGIVQSQQ